MSIHSKKQRLFPSVLFLAVTLMLIPGIYIGGVVATQDWPNPPFSTPNQDKPLISVLSPSHNQVCLSNNISIGFTVTKPQSWISGLTGTWITPGYLCWGKITTVGYYLNGIKGDETFASDPVEVGLRVYYEPPSRTLDFSINLSGLSEGIHSLIVSAEGESLYYEGQGQIWPSIKVVGNSSEIAFIVDTGPPRISLICPQNEVYNVTEIPLRYALNEPSRVTYSLDGLDNVTLSGNSTLTELSKGLHILIVYATDAAGNIGSSETITFAVAKPEISPFPTVPVTVASLASIVLAAAGLLVYFKKRKH